MGLSVQYIMSFIWYEIMNYRHEVESLIRLLNKARLKTLENDVFNAISHSLECIDSLLQRANALN